jgi:hypothetical protein
MRFDKTRQDELSRDVEYRLGRRGDPGRDLPDAAMLNGQILLGPRNDPTP